MVKTATIQETITFEIVTCCACGVPFGVSGDFVEHLQKTKDTFFCPNGHQQHYGHNEADRLKEELAAKQREIDAADRELSAQRLATAAARKQLASTRGQLTKVKKRIAAGVCPECHRHFRDLDDHMHDVHPLYVQEVDEEV